MQVEELYGLTSWIQCEIAEKQVVEKYQQLHKILQHNRRANQRKQPFEEQKAELISVLNNIALLELSAGQIDILDTINITKNVGQEGVSNVEDILFRNVIDIANAAKSIEQIIQDISQGVQWSEQIREQLKVIIDSSVALELGENVLLRIHFTRDAHLSNLTEFRD